MTEVKVCAVTKKCMCAICFFGPVKLDANACLVKLQHPAFQFFFYFSILLPKTEFFSLVRELQQDVKEFSLAELPEVDPEENSAEFMGILIKVTCTLNTASSSIHPVL